MTWRVRHFNKYGNKSTTYDGIQYASKFEADYAAELNLRKKAGDVKGWERQVPVELRVNGYLICRYYVDFKVVLADDTIEWVEIKGMELETWRLKRRLFEAAYLHEHPDEKYVVVKRKGW